MIYEYMDPEHFGCSSLRVPFSDVVEFMADPELYIAKSKGLTKEQWLTYSKNHGRIQCGWEIVSGRRCKNMSNYPVPSKVFFSHTWYCHKHDHGPQP